MKTFAVLAGRGGSGGKASSCRRPAKGYEAGTLAVLVKQCRNGAKGAAVTACAQCQRALPELYSDTIRFHKLYWQAHQHLPKAFRLTTGEQILQEITTCLGCVAAANFVNKSDTEARIRAARQLVHMRERLEVIRAFLILAWELKVLSHHALADLNARLDELGKQATRWQQWFGREGAV